MDNIGPDLHKRESQLCILTVRVPEGAANGQCRAARCPR
jgi:hypothetical protein